MRKHEQDEAFTGSALRHQEVEADVLEIWIAASRLLGRLAEPSRPTIRRKTRPRGRTIRVIKATASRSAPTP